MRICGNLRDIATFISGSMLIIDNELIEICCYRGM